MRDYFYRHFLGVVKVNSVPLTMAQPQIFSQKHDIEVRSAQMNMQVKVAAASLLARGSVSCSSRGFRSRGNIPCSSQGVSLAAQQLNVKEIKIKRYAPGGLALRTFSKLKVKTRAGMKQMTVLPQERANRLQWQLVRPRKEGEVILAWFGPIVEDAVAKLTLNKRRGTLLIWYNPQSRYFTSKGLYLYRRMELKENLEWRWV